MRIVNNLNFIIIKRNVFKIILYPIIFFILISLAYFFTPKLFDYSPQLVKEKLKQNNNINIKDILKINYKAFPSPRLRISGSNFTMEEGAIAVENSEIDIILNISGILNNKKLVYNKLFIKKGSSKVNINNINQLLNSIEKNKKKIFFKENNLILVQNNKSLIEINNSLIKINFINGHQELNINGIFLNHKILIKLDSKLENKSNLILEIPGLDILTKVSFETSDTSSIINGLVNFKVLNNYLQFNFTKVDTIKTSNGFFRNNLINLFFEGDIIFNPSFFVKLDLKPTILNMEKLFPIIQKKYFSDDIGGLALIKKINGSFKFKSKFDGVTTFENGKISFKNFKTGNNKSLYFDAEISEFGKKGKIQFNLLKTIQYKRGSSKQIKILGFIIPSNSKIIFEKMSLDNNEYSTEEIKNYEKQFANEVIQNSLKNIFNDSKLNQYFKNLVN